MLPLQFRSAALRELVLAVELLVDGNQFTAGIASAAAAHIKQTLHDVMPSTQLGLPVRDIYLEHAQLLPPGPLMDLLHFFWIQIGLRYGALPAVQEWRQRLRQVPVPA